MALVMWNCHYRLNICIVTWSCHYSLQDCGNIIISQYLNTMEIECVFCALVFLYFRSNSYETGKLHRNCL